MSSKRLSPTETCRDFVSLLPLASSHLLTPDVSARLNTHVATCAFCRAQLADYERADASLVREFARRQSRAPRLSRAEIQQILGGCRIPLARARAVNDPSRVFVDYEPLRVGTVFSGVSNRRRRVRRALSLGAAAAVVFALLALAVGLFSMLRNVPTGGSLAPDLSQVHLNNLAMESASEGWAVGDDTAHAKHGVILHYTGGKWEQVSTPSDAGMLWGICMLSSSDGWIVGDQGIILHYDGQSWQQMQSPVKTALGSVFMLSPTDGWAAGNEILHYSNGVWTRVASASEFIYQIQMLSATEGWAVGPARILHYYAGVWTPTYVRSPGRGAHLKTPPSYPVIQPQALSISMLSANEGWAVGLSQENMLHYQQGQWQIFPSPDAAANLQAVAMISPDEGWAMGIDPTNDHGVVYHYLHDTWTSVVSPTTQAMSHIVMLSPSEGWAVGTGATVLHYSHGTWNVAFAG